MPGGYSSLGGYGFNPYDPRAAARRRRPAGAVDRLVRAPGPASPSRANLAALASARKHPDRSRSGGANGIVGIKPTVGLVSRGGIIPISADQDTAGPMARTVRTPHRSRRNRGLRRADPATQPCLRPGNCFDDYTQFSTEALRARASQCRPFRQLADHARSAIAVCSARALTVDQRFRPPRAGVRPGILNYGFKRDLNAYLRHLPEVRPVTRWPSSSRQPATPGALKYGQTQALASQALDISPGQRRYRAYLTDRPVSQPSRGCSTASSTVPDGISGTADDFDALLNAGAGTPARAGYPSIIVPGGFLPPDGDVINPRPSGVQFTGSAFSEPRLIALGYAFEQATKYRRPPDSTPPLPSDTVRGKKN